MKFSLNKVSIEGVIVEQFFVDRPDSQHPVTNLFSAVDEAFDRWACSVHPAMRSINGIGVDVWVTNLRDGHDLMVSICK